MAGPRFSKAVAPIFTLPFRFATVAGTLAARARFRFPQPARILRVLASHRLSDATALTVDAQIGGVSILTAPLDLIPTAAPAAPVAADAGVAGLVELGAHSYKVAFFDAAGEHTQASVKSNVVTPAAPAAVVAALVADAGGAVEAGDRSYKVTFVNATGESVASAKSNVVTTDGAHTKVDLTIPAGPAGTTARKLYRTVAGDAGDHLLLATVADNVTLAYQDNISDVALGAAAPADAGSQVNVTIPTGPTGTVSRGLYRTVTGDAGDHLEVTSIADNVTTAYVDNVADVGLGAAAPTANTFTDGDVQEEALTDPHDLASGVAVAKEAELTVDVALTGTQVDDLSVQIDYLPVD